MPSVSKAQAHFMAAAAHNPKFAKEAGISQSVAREFNAADTGKTKDLPARIKRRVADHLIGKR